MKSIVIYNSQTGFTKKYADWISEATGCKTVPFKQATKINLFEYDAVIFGSWCKAGHIQKIKWFKKIMPEIAEAGKNFLYISLAQVHQKVQKFQLLWILTLQKPRKKLLRFFIVPVV